MNWFRSIDVTAETTDLEIWTDAGRRGALVGVVFGALIGAGSGPAQGATAGVFFAVLMAVFFARDLARHRSRARDAPSGRVTHRPRPAYMPSRWHDREADHWAMRTPLRALIYWTIPGMLAAIALFLRIVFPDWFADDGTPDATIIIAAPILLGVCWVFGLRAWREYRRNYPT